jgi:hypothetical protein
MDKHYNTGSCPNATGLFDDLPLFRWADTRLRSPESLLPSLAVTVLVPRFCLSEPLARAIAENAGLPVEAARA